MPLETKYSFSNSKIICGILSVNQPPLKIEQSQLQTGWDAPDIRLFTQKAGDQFLTDQNNLLLSVPSVIMPEENNFLINPNHTDMKKVKISFKRRISFDNRISENL